MGRYTDKNTQVHGKVAAGFEPVRQLFEREIRAMAERVRTWVHEQEKDAETNLGAIEERMDPDLADEIYELDRCIECGCCISACGTKRMRDDFLGAAGFLRVARLHMDPRDERKDDDWYEIIGDDDGIFGCMSLMGCQDVCPKNLSLQTQLAFLRRKMIRAALI